MMGRTQHRQEQLFCTAFSLDERIGPDNRLRRIRDGVGFSFARPAVSHLYGDVGNPSVDPIVLLKLMLISFLENIPGERELMRRLPERLDWLWCSSRLIALSAWVVAMGWPTSGNHDIRPWPRCCGKAW